MDGPVMLAWVIHGELPFTLNLPDGTYPVQIDGSAYPIAVLQNRLAVADGHDTMRFGTEAELRSHFGDRWGGSFKHELRTVVSNFRQVEVPRADLPVPTADQMFAAAQYHMMTATPGIAPGRPDQLQLQARHWLDSLDDDGRRQFAADTSVRFALARAFPHSDVDYFVGAVNRLIRLYMARFNDRFVQEVTQGMFSIPATKGLHVAVYCDGQPIQVTRYAAGLFPYLSPRMWQQHPQAEIEAFRTQLQTSPEPDPVALLHVRALSLLERGAYRSAMLEASAAFDLCLVRKIRSGLLAKGKTDPEIETLLEQNPRYEERAKGLLKKATGKSAPEVDNTAWERFRQNRKNRGTIAHSANEPDEADATAAVGNMIALTEAIDRLPI